MAVSLCVCGRAGAEEPPSDRQTAPPSARHVTGATQHLQQIIAGEGTTMIFRLTPVATHPGGSYAHGGAYSDADISGQTLTIGPALGPGLRTFWNLFLSDWDPNSDGPPVRTWQARIDLATGLVSGEGGALTKPIVSCGSPSDCTTAFGESTNSTVCSGNQCKYAWINKVRADGFRQNPEAGCDPFTWDVGTTQSTGPLFFASTNPECLMPDPHTWVYGGTIALDVPADAEGTYTLPFIFSETFAVTNDSVIVPILELRPGVLVVRACLSDSDCDDDDACTIDGCNDPLGAGFCTNDPIAGWDSQTQCCNPENAAVRNLQSTSPCLIPSCSLGDGRGTLVLTPEPQGTACTTNDPCKMNESCDDAGVCVGEEFNGPACLKPRYISLVPAGPTAIRVWLTSLHHPQPGYDIGVPADFSAFEGQARWVGPVGDCLDSDESGPTFKCARLQCSPHYAGWSAELAGEVLHVTGEAVVPSSEFDIEQVDISCAGKEEACGTVYAEPSAETGRWGDVVSGYQDTTAQYQSQPNVLDIFAVVVKLKGIAGQVIKPRVHLDGDDLDPTASITILEVSRIVDVIKGGGYPFDGPSPCEP